MKMEKNFKMSFQKNPLLSSINENIPSIKKQFIHINLLPIYEFISEQNFPDYMNRRGYQCIKFIAKNHQKILDLVGEEGGKLFPHHILSLAYYAIGKPDFFVWREKEFWLCEFKSSFDTLSFSQLNWLCNHDDIPLIIAKVIPRYKEDKEFQRRIENTQEESIYAGVLDETLRQIEEGDLMF